MFLNMIPKEPKNEIAKERHSIDASHVRLASWCRSRATVLQHETLAEIVKNNLTSSSRGKVHAAKPTSYESEADEPPPEPAPHLAPDVPAWAQSLVAAITQRPPKKPRTDETNGRNTVRTPSDRRRNSQSPGRNLVV